MVLITEHENLQTPTLQAFIENAPAQSSRRLSNAFPTEQVFDINVAYNVIDSTGIKAGSIIGFDAATPLRKKGDIQQVLAKLSKIAHAYHYTEEEMYRYKNSRNSAEQDALVQNALLSIADLSEGIEDTKELIRANMVYRGVFDYEDPKSEVKIQFDLDLPDEAKTTAGDFSRADVNPLEVLMNEVEKYKERNNGQAPAYVVMNSKTLAKIKRNPNVAADLYGSEAGNKIVRQSDLDTLFTDIGLPKVEIDDAQTIIEGITGDIVKKHLDDDVVVLHAANLGNTLSGPAADNNFANGKYVVSVVSQDPVGEKTIVGEVAMPVLKNIKGISIITANEQAEETSEVPEG